MDKPQHIFHILHIGSQSLDSFLNHSLANKKICPQIDTMFMAASEKHMYLSSTVVKELGKYGTDLSDFVPAEILDIVTEKIKMGGK